MEPGIRLARRRAIGVDVAVGNRTKVRKHIRIHIRKHIRSYGKMFVSKGSTADVRMG